MAVNYIMGLEASLNNYVIDLRNGSILLNDLKFKSNPTKISPFSVRLSRNIRNFITKTHVNSGVFPAMVATATAFHNEELMMVKYLDCLYEELP